MASTGAPLLAAYLSDSDCAVLCAAVPGRVGPLTHLWDVSGPCGVYAHQPDHLPPPAGRRLDDVVAELTAWSAAAGLRADAGRVRAVLAEDRAGVADDGVFDLVRALGVERIGPARPRALPVDSWPFSGFMHGYGPAVDARVRAIERAEDGVDAVPTEPWETAALALEAELWAAVHRPGADLDALALRVVQVQAEARAARRATD